MYDFASQGNRLPIIFFLTFKWKHVRLFLRSSNPFKVAGKNYFQSKCFLMTDQNRMLDGAAVVFIQSAILNFGFLLTNLKSAALIFQILSKSINFFRSVCAIFDPPF